MSSIPDSYLGRRQFIFDSIGRSFSKNVVKSKINQNISAISQLIIECGKAEDTYCEDCLLKFFTRDQIEDENFAKNKPLISKIQKTACAGNCYCEVSDINFSNVINLNADAVIGEGDVDVDQIQKDVKKDIQDKYGENNWDDKYNKYVVDIVIQISTSSVQNINQIINSSQTIVAKGTGYKIKGITMDICINAVLKAIADNSGSIDLVDDIVTEQMNKIRQQVDKDVIDSFSYAWQQSKTYVIAIGLFILALMLLISGMLIYRAVNGPSK